MGLNSTLEWKVFSGGRMLMACSSRGYYELTLGGRALYTQLVSGSLVTNDLGPCTQETMEQCQRLCEEHSRQIIRPTAY